MSYGYHYHLLGMNRLSIQRIAEIATAVPGHLWVILAAGAIVWCCLKWRSATYTSGVGILCLMFGLLIALAVVPNGYHMMFPPTGAEAIWEARNSPNYDALFVIDLVFVACGAALGYKFS